MKRSITAFGRVFLLSAAIVFAAGALNGAVAQGKEASMAPHWLEVTTVMVRPEKVGEFRNFIKNEFNPALVKGGVKISYTWHTAVFGDEFIYYFVSPIEKFAEYDGQSPLEKALGAEAMGPFFTRAGALVISVHTTAMMERSDLTYIGKTMGEPKMAVMIGVNVSQGHEAEFEAFMMNEYLPAFKRSDAKAFLAHQTVFGGSQSEYVMLGLIDNFADLDKGHPIMRVLGKDGFKKLIQKLPAGAVSESEVSIISLDRALSIMPPAPPK